MAKCQICCESAPILIEVAPNYWVCELDMALLELERCKNERHH